MRYAINVVSEATGQPLAILGVGQPKRGLTSNEVVEVALHKLPEEKTSDLAEAASSARPSPHFGGLLMFTRERELPGLLFCPNGDSVDGGLARYFPVFG